MDINKTLELDKTERFEDEYNGEKFWFDVRSNSLTPEVLQAWKDQVENPIEQARALSKMLTQWNITWDGEPFPPTVDNLKRLPEKFLVHVMRTISASWSGNEQSPSGSANS